MSVCAQGGHPKVGSPKGLGVLPPIPWGGWVWAGSSWCGFLPGFSLDPSRASPRYPSVRELSEAEPAPAPGAHPSGCGIIPTPTPKPCPEGPTAPAAPPNPIGTGPAPSPTSPQKDAESRAQGGHSQEAKGVRPRHGLAVPHQEAAVPARLGQQVLGHHPADVPVVPAGRCHPPGRQEAAAAPRWSQPHISPAAGR